MILICPKCAHEWNYTGKNKSTMCPRCKAHITVSLRAKRVEEEPQPQPEEPKEEGEDKPEGEAKPEGGDEPEPEVEPSEPDKKPVEGKPISIVGGITVKETPVEMPEGFKESIETKPDEKPKGKVKKPVNIPPASIRAILEAGFDMWADWENDESFKLNKVEMDSLSPLVKQALDEHAGEWMAEYSNTVALALVAGFILSRRVIKHVRKKDGPKKEVKYSAPTTGKRGKKVNPLEATNIPAKEDLDDQKPSWMGVTNK